MMMKVIVAVCIAVLSPVIIVDVFRATISTVYARLKYIWSMRKVIRASGGTMALRVAEKVSQSPLCRALGRPVLRVCGIKNIDLGSGVFKHFVPIRHLMPHEEWAVDYPWFLGNLAGSRLLDTGFITHNWFTQILCNRGYGVTGVDCGQWAYHWRSQKFNYICADLTDPLPFPDAYFDTIVSPSLIEHLGLGFYGDKVKENADIGTVREFYRVLKPRGVLLAEVPFSSARKLLFWHNRPFQWNYSSETLRLLFADFHIAELSFARFVGDKGSYDPGPLPQGHWQITDEFIASQVEWEKDKPPRCIVRIKAQKLA